MTTHSCRLALSMPDPSGAPLDSEIFDKILAAGDLAALLVPEGAPGFSGADSARLLAAQEKGIACLLASPEPCSLPAGYDGLMFGPATSANDLKRIRDELGADVMIGAYTDCSRDHAMQKGDAAIDVLGFAFDGSPEKLGPLCEIIGWWSDVFVIPCLVSGNIGISAAAALIKSGADFIAPDQPVWAGPSGPAAALSAYHNLIAGKSWA